MKLLYCKGCGDVFSLRREMRHCACGASAGLYRDYLHAEIWGYCIPLGFNNNTVAEALRDRPKSGLGKRFEAFVIPEEVATIRVHHEDYPVPDTAPVITGEDERLMFAQEYGDKPSNRDGAWEERRG